MILLTPGTRWISPLPLLAALLVMLCALSCPFSRPAFAQARPPLMREPNQRVLPNSAILGEGPYAATIERLHVVRQYPLSDVRSNPQMTLGDTHLDFTPLLNNPRALVNVAQRLHAMPQQVEVRQDSSDVNEVDQGLVIHQVLSYRILPGKCADPRAKEQLASAGIGCFTRATTSQRVQEFSMPGSPRYVADPGRRQAAIAAYLKNSALQQADADSHIADLRKQLANPAQRAAIVAQVGADEATRMDKLSDTELEEEVINSATQSFEETIFVPTVESANYAHPPYSLNISPGAAEIAATHQLLSGSPGASPSNFPKLMRIVPPANFHNSGSTLTPGGDQVTDFDLGTYYYLTGFTIGHDYEWKLGISTTINWCVVGCSSTYSVNLYAGFNYGFGLRFPIQADLKYHNVVHPNNSADATMTADFEPIEGNDQDFQATGLSGDQLFDAKELVAQVGANAGFNFNLPVIGSNGMGFSVGVDFTNFLPAPYTGGHFLPPAPGTGGINSPFILNQIDLLGGLLNFGVVGGQVFPAVNINLHSNKLQFTLNDEISRRQILVPRTGQTFNVSAESSPGHDSHFGFGNPVYNLGFTLTPGIDAHAFVDLAVWSDSWDWPVWFPQLAVNLPPGGVDFSCHQGTTCVFDFQPVTQAAVTSGLIKRLESEGCTQRGNVLACTRLQGYLDCDNAVKTEHPLGVQSCDPGMVLKEEDSADRTLTGGGCQRNGSIGNYLCPMEQGMLGLCNTMLNNGAILSCGILVPTSTDQILKRGGCTGDAGKPGAYLCPSGMMGLCQLYVSNKVIFSCQKK